MLSTNLQNFLLEIVRLVLGNVWNRTGSVLTILGASALTGWVDQLVAHLFSFKLEQTAPWVGFCVMATGIWMLAFGAGKATMSANPHDIQLFARFRERFDDDLMYFLRSHDFGGSFSRRIFQVGNEISATWVGPRYQFEDKEMAAVWEKLFAKNRELTHLIAVNTTPEPGNYDWCRPYWIDHDDISAKTQEKIDTMNDVATELAECIDELEAVARKKRISTPG